MTPDSVSIADETKPPIAARPQPARRRAFLSAALAATLREAFTRFRDDVRDGNYPSDEESYHWSGDLREQFGKWASLGSVKDEG